ncbi:MAG: bifunctional oligoribonuclease/PAP phosphatase NrnA [Flavobacteriales bacterium]
MLVPHQSPDGDAMGACLGLYHFLKKIDQNPQVISPTDYPRYLKWMPGIERVWIYARESAPADRLLERADLIFYLDFNTVSRTHKMREALVRSQAAVVLIDHHHQPDTFSYVYSDVGMSSTCEMVYHFISKLCSLESIDKEIATCLYTGIMTDTGSFRFSGTSPTTYRVAADLVERGADGNEIHERICDGYTVQRINLLVAALQNLKVLAGYNTAYIVLWSEELVKNNYQRGDAEGFVNYALALAGIRLAALFVEDRERGRVKISFRSKGGFSVCELASQYFNGGGHTNAAGGISERGMSETLAYFESLLARYRGLLYAHP